MPYLAIEDIDDFVEAALAKQVEPTWQDISLKLQDYWFAERLFNKAKSESMEGPEVRCALQVANPGNHKFTGLYADDTTNRVNMLTHGKMGWSMNTTNYTYDIMEPVFRTSKVSLLNYLDVQEHGMYNDYFEGMEAAMFGTGPLSPTQDPMPPSSLLWWITPYDTDSGYGNNSSTYQLPSGAKSGFLGMDPYGFSSVGTGGVLSTTYSGWRNRVGQYTQFTEDDAIKTVVECMAKCRFTPAQSYQQTVTGKPRWELLTTYSRVQAAQDIAGANNDNVGSEVAKYRDTPTIRGVPLVWIPAWTNSESGCQQTNGPVMGVDWTTFKYYFAAGSRMVKRTPFQDATKHNVRWRVMDDTGQIVCFDRRRNFIVTSTATVTETD